MIVFKINKYLNERLSNLIPYYELPVALLTLILCIKLLFDALLSRKFYAYFIQDF